MGQLHGFKHLLKVKDTNCREKNRVWTVPCQSLNIFIISLDINECASSRACTNIANAKCENRQGGYICVCVDGFKRTSQGCVGRSIFGYGKVISRSDSFDLVRSQVCQFSLTLKMKK